MIEQFTFSVLRNVAYNLLGKISKKLQLKFFPFEQSHLKINIENSPTIYINVKENLAYLRCDIKINNYTNYDLTFFSAEGEIYINSKRFVLLNRNLIHNLKRKNSMNYWFNKNLNLFETKKVIEVFGKYNALNSKIHLTFYVMTLFNYLKIKQDIEFNMILNRMDNEEI